MAIRSLLSGLLIGFALAAGCTTKDESLWAPKIYLPDPVKGDIQRQGERVDMRSTEAGKFVCMPKADLEVLHRECLDPKPWYEEIF